jgi:hypothetical protein
MGYQISPIGTLPASLRELQEGDAWGLSSDPLQNEMMILNQLRDEVYTLGHDMTKTINSLEVAEEGSDFRTAYPKIGYAIDCAKEAKKAMDDFVTNMENYQSQMINFMQETIYFDGDIINDMQRLFDPEFMQSIDTSTYDPSTDEISKLLKDPQWAVFASADTDLLVRAIEAMNNKDDLQRQQLYEELLAQFNEREVAKVRAKLISYDDNGNDVYINWDNIQAILQKQAKYITEAEYYAMAEVYSNMNPLDMEKFLPMLTEKSDTFNGPVPSEWGGTKQTALARWKFDFDKLAGIMRNLDRITLSQALEGSLYEQMTFKEFMANPEMQKKFGGPLTGALREKFGDTLDETEFDAFKIMKLDATRAELDNTIQKSALLALALQISQDSKYTINSLGEAEYPTFKIDRVLGNNGKADYLLTYNTVKDTKLFFDDPNSLSEKTYSASAALNPDAQLEQTIELVAAFFDDKFDTNLAPLATDAGRKFVTDQSLGKAYEALGEFLEKGTNVVGKTIGGFIPGGAAFIQAGAELGKEYAEKKQDQKEADSVMKVIALAPYIQRFKLRSSMTSSVDGKIEDTRMVLAPGFGTFSQFENLEKYVNENKEKLLEFIKQEQDIAFEEIESFISSLQFSDIFNKANEMEDLIGIINQYDANALENIFD